MKTIFYYLVILGVVFTSCNPNEDIYNEIDAIANPIVGETTYTLTSEDYDDLDLGFGNFGSVDEAKLVLPDFLADKYPTWGAGSTVTVNYNLFIGSAEGVSDYSGADVYQLTNADYASTGSDAFGFYPNVDATDELPDVLAAQIASPAEGQIVLAQYKQYFATPEIGLANIYEAAFPANFVDFELISLSGPLDLGWTVGASNVQGSGFTTMANAVEEWLVSPEIDLTGQSNLFFQITQEIDFLGDDTLIDILVSTDYTTGGDVMAATWTALDFDKTIFGSLTTSEDLDFSAYDGQTVHVALKYSSTDSDSPRWRVQDFAVKAIGVSGERNSKGEFFVYESGAWEPSEGVYYVSSADFDSMGEGSGQPGQFNNFSSSVSPDDYLPTFLSLMPPYAFGQNDDEVIVVYDYFSSSSGAQIRGNLYTVVDNEWTAHESTIETSLQFGHDGSTWVPDNTIRYTFTGDDVAFISNAFLSIYEGPAENVGFFGSFDRRPTSSNFWSDEMLLEAFNVLLENGNFVTDEEQKYILTYIIYNGSTTNESKSVIKMDGEWIYQ